MVLEKQLISILAIFILILLLATCTTELPQNYFDLGEIEISASKLQITLLLPYSKPEDIEYIYTKAPIGIFICKIIGDGKEIKPKRIFDFMGSSEDSFRYKETYETNIDKGYVPLEIKMIWYKIINGKKPSLYYKTVSGYKGNSYSYKIPNNIREIYINYRILFPYRSMTEATEEQTVYFKINWL